jgi:hypothetical protein
MTHLRFGLPRWTTGFYETPGKHSFFDSFSDRPIHLAVGAERVSVSISGQIFSGIAAEPLSLQD